eukprot:c38956_g1_i1.p1 GENE.c38956_g1_i1~~c38956_g1_i1.p1  ORF type:complete len:377 (-),score=59.58 c38956_g1_i1:42-1103(-)
MSPSRRPSGGKNPIPKGGAGGKGTWGRPGDELVPLAMDPNDPNYDVEQVEPFTLDEYQPRPNGKEYKQLVTEALLKFNDIGDINQAAVELAEIRSPLYDWYIVSRALALLLPKQRGLVTSLILHLRSAGCDLVSQEHLEHGFAEAFSRIDEWELDAPGISEAIYDVAQRLVDSDHLTSSFVTSYSNLPKDLPSFKARLDDALDEFFVSLDRLELIRQIATIDGAAFRPHIVKGVVKRALDHPPTHREAAVLALIELQSNKVVSTLQFMHGIELLLGEADDMTLDNPNTTKDLTDVIVRVVVDECVPPSFLQHVFSLSQNDCGHEILVRATNALKEPGIAQTARNVWVAQSDDV